MKKSIFKYVLLSDVVGSRKIKDRKKFESILTKTLQSVQQQFSDVFEMPIQVWKGLDETAAVLQKPWRLYEVMDKIDELLAPCQMRFVLVKGTMDVLPRNGNISQADGEVFHMAAIRMHELKKEGLKFSCFTGKEAFDKPWCGQVNLLWLIKENWTERQREVYRRYCETGVQGDVAKQLNISQQNVSKTLQSIAAAQVQRLEKIVSDWTEQEFKNNVLD